MTIDGAWRVLQVTRNFPPLLGGMERLNWHVAAQLLRQGPLRLVAPRGARAQAPTGVEVIEAGSASPGAFLPTAAWLALRAAHAWRPTLVLAGSGLAAPLALAAARASKARAAAYLHGLDISVPHPAYRALWWPALRRLDRVLVNSRATAELARKAGIDPSRLRIVHPGVELRAPDPTARARMRAALGVQDRALLLAVGRLTRRKGLLEFVRDVLPIIVARRPDALLVVIGEAPSHALHAHAVTPEDILHAARVAGVEAHLRLLGRFDEARLADAYQGCDVHVFPVRSTEADPEGFGMVAIEAAAHGLPTLAYASGGVVDAVADGVSGRLIEPGNAAAFAAAVVDTLATPPSVEALRAFAANFAWPQFGQRLVEALA